MRELRLGWCCLWDLRSSKGSFVGGNPPPTAACETVSVLEGAQCHNVTRSFATVCTWFIS